MEEILIMIKALSDSNRLFIFTLLKGKKMCACEILEKCNCGQATLSHHMKNLVESGLVLSTKEGKWVHYELNPEKVNQLSDFIDLHTKMEGEDESCNSSNNSGCCFKTKS